MTISIWRYSHLTLAISSALFIFIAAVTGIILAFEPITNQLKSHDKVDLTKVSIAETITVLQKNYDETVTLSVDENDFVIASVITKKEKSETFYINPKNGKKVGEILPKKPIFEFATNLHRSLFLKSTGRFIVGFFSFLLFLIAITGIILIAKRQGGFLKIFTKIVKEDFHQYYHILLGRWFVLPILIVTLTGVYLSLEKFSLLPKEKSTHQKIENTNTTPKQKITDFDIFKNTTLNKVQQLEFPFSEDDEDYFFIKLNDKEFAIHQYSGQIISQKKKKLATILSAYSLFLHTGRGSSVWSFVLLISCFVILFFIFSGFSMTVKRRKTKASFTNKYSKDEAEFIILLGSETGSTFKFANALFTTLLNQKKHVFLDELNNYSSYKNAQHLIIFTATYGNGDAPTNANAFLKKLHKTKPTHHINFSVVGFGSRNYPEFCKFAILVQASLQVHEKFTPILPLFKVNNNSFTDFNKWYQQWKSIYQIQQNIEEQVFISENKIPFKIVRKTVLNVDDTFLIELKPTKKTQFTSGDVLAITPKNENLARLYSIAKVGKNILLSVKKHKLGICSNYLNSLTVGEKIEATIQKNQKFYFPKKSKEVILIANGTGIAPFLGMIAKNKHAKISLFWGGKTLQSLAIYKPYIDKALYNKSLNSFEAAYSKEHQQKVYVQDLVKKYNHLIASFLKNGNSILICGSLAMQQGVEKELSTITTQLLKTSLSTFKEKGQIQTDCY